MRDKSLEEKISRLEEVLRLWDDFRQMADAVLKGAEFDDSHDRNFLEIKSEIARKYQSLADRFPKKALPDEEIGEVLSTAVSFEHLQKLTPFARDEFRTLWHKVYILLNRMLGHLESERSELRKVSRSGVWARNVFRSRKFKVLMVLIIAAAAIFGAHRSGMFSVPEEEEAEAEAGGAAVRELSGRMRRMLDSIVEKLRRGEAE